MNMPESNYSLLALCLLVQVRDDAEEVLLRAIRLAIEIADNQRDIWLHQRCEAE